MSLTLGSTAINRLHLGATEIKQAYLGSTLVYDKTISGGGDPHSASVVFLSHFDGVDGATSATDRSGSAHPVTFNGNARIDTSRSRFGTASLLLDGTGDHVSVPDHAEFGFGSGPFTVEGWFSWAAAVADVALIAKWTTTGDQRAWQIFHDPGTGRLVFWRSSTGADFTSLEGVFAPVVDQWHHIAADYDGTKLRLYADGAVVASEDAALSLFDGSAPLTIGARGNPDFFFNGRIDEVRITRGVARYGSDAGFTVPSAAFPDS